MTLKIEPAVSAGSKQLDRWRKVEDNGSGVTFFYRDFGGSFPPSSEPRRLPNSNAGNYASHSSPDAGLPGQTWRRRGSQPIWANSTSERPARPRGSLSPITDAALPSLADQQKATVLVRKPRTRRLFQSLLCCFGARPKEISGNFAPFPPTDFVDSSNARYSPKLSEKLLLPPLRPVDANKKSLIIDLDETLVHSSFKPVKNPDFIIPVEIDGVVHQVYVLKRPFVDEFLQRIGNLFECILFTASLAKYADPVSDLLDRWGVFRARLFREACVFHKGNYVKDLNRLGRDLKRVVIMDNSPASYAFHPDNAIPVQSWFDDANDTELLDLVPFLEKLAREVDNVPLYLRNCNEPHQITAGSGR